MKRLILVVFPLFFSGCAVVTQQKFDESNKDRVKLKKAVVKLIEKNNEVKQTLKDQEMKTKELNLKVLYLKNEMKHMNEELKKLQKMREKKEPQSQIEPQIQEDMGEKIFFRKSNLLNSFYIRVNSDKANLRVEPSPEAVIDGVASKGDIFEVIEKSKEEFLWYKIIYKDRLLWIYSETVEIIEGENE
jgi:hypothetical protein